MRTREEFLALVEEHLTRTGAPATVFSKDVCGDPNFVRQLREGRSPNLDTVEKVMRFIEARTEAA